MEEGKPSNIVMSAIAVAGVLPGGSHDQTTVATPSEDATSSQFFINNYTADDITDAFLMGGRKAVYEQQRKRASGGAIRL